MNVSVETKRPKYPSGMAGVYTSAILSVLSAILAVLLFFDKPFLLLFYLSTSAVITVAVFEVKNRILYIRQSKYKDEEIETEYQGQGGTRWRMLLLTLVILLMAITVPLGAAYFLDPAAWVVFLVSFTTGVSVAEVTLYLHLRRPA